MIVATLTKLTNSGSGYEQTYTTPIIYIPDESSPFSLTNEGITVIGDIQENNSAVIDMTLQNQCTSLCVVDIVEGPVD